MKTKKIYSSEKKWDKNKDLILYFLLFLSILVGWLLKFFNQSERLKISIAYNLCCKIFIGLDPIVSILKLFGGNLDLFMTSTPSSLWGIILQRQIRCKWSCQWRCRKRSVQIFLNRAIKTMTRHLWSVLIADKKRGKFQFWKGSEC